MQHAMGHITLLFSCPECEQHEKMYSLLVQMEQSPMTANREAFSNRSWVTNVNYFFYSTTIRIPDQW